MNHIFATRHLSPPDFYHKGGSQYSSNEVLYIFCRERRKPLGDQTPTLRALPAVGSGARGTAAFPHRRRLASGRGRGSKTSGGTGGRDVTSPPAELNPHYPPRLLISAADTWWQGRGQETTPPEIGTAVGCRISLESAEKASKQAITGCWQSGCVVSVLQVWAWLMRKLWREANSLSTWLSQPFLTRVGLGTDGVQHRDCTARAVQVTDEYQGSKMLLLDLSAVFDALRYCWVAFDPRQE